jgi:hypothetical protein
VETEPFAETFGPKAQRKRPRLDVGSFEELGNVGAAAAENAENAADEGGTGVIGTRALNFQLDTLLITSPEPLASSVAEPQTHADYIEPIYAKGTSRRIYGELYKVIDSSDVILHVIDARDPLGTLCESVLEYIKKEKAHKQVVLVINKCDLVPNWVTVCSSPVYETIRPLITFIKVSLYPTPHSSLSDNRVSCISQPFVRQGIIDSTVASVFATTLGQEANFCRFRWVSQCGKE